MEQCSSVNLKVFSDETSEAYSLTEDDGPFVNFEVMSKMKKMETC